MPRRPRENPDEEKNDPQSKDLREKARSHVNVAVDALARVAGSRGDPKAVVMAAKELLDRGYGRPQPAIKVPGGALKGKILLDFEGRNKKPAPPAEEKAKPPRSWETPAHEADFLDPFFGE